jgi:two-component system response regulator CpxR
MSAATNLATRLLVVDDDLKLCRLVRGYLEPLGYQVSLAHDGEEGLRLALSGDFDAVLLDVMMPKMDGLQVLRTLREKSGVPVLMLTGLGEEADRIVGLEIGADDYLPKTFSTRELLARLRAVIRRSRFRSETAPIAPTEVGDLYLNIDTRECRLAGNVIGLTTVEFDLLLALARAAGRVKSRERLLVEIAERDFEAFDRSIDVHISSIRRKLGDDPKTPRYIETIRGVGYRMPKPGVASELP